MCPVRKYLSVHYSFIVTVTLGKEWINKMRFPEMKMAVPKGCSAVSNIILAVLGAGIQKGSVPLRNLLESTEASGFSGFKRFSMHY